LPQKSTLQWLRLKNQHYAHCAAYRCTTFALVSI